MLFGQTIITDRPDQMESSVVVPRGWLQGEQGMQIISSPYVQQVDWWQQLWRIGVSSVAELRLGHVLSTFYQEEGDRHTSLGQYSVGTKVQLWRKPQLQVALIAALNLAVLRAKLSSRQLCLAVATPLGTEGQLGVNVAWYRSYTEMPQHRIDWSASASYALNERTSWFFELFSSGIRPSAISPGLHTGMTYLTSAYFQFDTSFGIQLDSYTYFASIGCSFIVQ